MRLRRQWFEAAGESLCGRVGYLWSVVPATVTVWRGYGMEEHYGDSVAWLWDGVLMVTVRRGYDSVAWLKT